ncbi:ATP-binding protein [Herbivorax sp. ANBcel31]|uniref:ATP-binding protein n=1 Tax=Herbivorax sp. ANBcel31 TaxID=3069754 RepID=UPI0027B15117|nr:ATP-binding protein [Herbivorax sp. ANBcel31]MDQ2085069.1 ATP-binding protein [Herbivorax sp. ANBcel31]
MKIRSKLFLVIATLIFCIIFSVLLLIYEINESSSNYQTIIKGHDLIIDFEIALGSVNELISTQDLMRTKDIWIESINNYSDSLSDFVESKNLKDLLSDEDIKFKYDSLVRVNESANSRFLVIKNQLNQIENNGTLQRIDLTDPTLLYENRDLYFTYYEIRELKSFFSLNVRDSINSLVDALHEKSELDQIRKRNIYFTILFFLCTSIIIFSVIIINRISKNVSLISKAISNISKGNFTKQQYIKTNDEFGILYKDINGFTDDLKDNVGNIIQFTKELAQKNIKETDISNVHENIVMQIVNYTTADGAALYLLNNQKDVLTIKNIAGTFYSPELIDTSDVNKMNDEKLKSFFLNKQVSIENSLVGNVLKTNENIFIKDTENDILSKELSYKIKELVYSMIFIPLIVSDQTIGVISIMKLKENDALTDLDYIHVKSFTEYAGLAIDNFNKLKIQAEKNQLEREIKIQKIYEAKLKNSNKELEDFAHIVSHDLKAPLRQIAAFSKNLDNMFKDRFDSMGTDLLNRIVVTSNYMQKLINGLLEYSRITSKPNPIEKVDLQKIINETVSDFEIQICEKNAELKIDYLPSIEADPIQMRQLFQNLIGNALKYQEKDKKPYIEISSSLVTDEKILSELNPNRRYYEIKVKDNGIGFESKFADEVFGVFHRLVGKNEYEGTGIGLSICQKIVKRHGGIIKANSALGEGSTFSVILPEDN